LGHRHPNSSAAIHPTAPALGADKGPIYVINYSEPKYIFFPPKNAPRRTQKRETVSGHFGSDDYEGSHAVDTCLQVPPTPPNSAVAPPSPPAPSASDLPYPPSQRTLLLILTSPALRQNRTNLRFLGLGQLPLWIDHIG